MLRQSLNVTRLGLGQKTRAHISFFSTSANSVYEKIAFIGAGKMAQALMHPLIEQKVQPAEKITVYDVSNSTMKKISEQYDGKINTSESIPHALQGADLIILAVKPQNVCKVYEEMRKTDISKNSTLLSVIAGKPISVSSFCFVTKKTFCPLFIMMLILFIWIEFHQWHRNGKDCKEYAKYTCYNWTRTDSMVFHTKY